MGLSQTPARDWISHLYRAYIVGNDSPFFDDPDFKGTPRRLDQSMRELLRGHSVEAQDDIQEYFQRTFPVDRGEMITILEIKASGVCPHHLLPVLYSVDFSYIPEKKVIGLSKVPRIIRLLAARAVLHENLTTDIADLFSKELDAKGVAVVVHGFHTCMALRGVNARETSVVSSAMRGVYIDNEDNARDEFLALSRDGKGMPWA